MHHHHCHSRAEIPCAIARNQAQPLRAPITTSRWPKDTSARRCYMAARLLSMHRCRSHLSTWSHFAPCCTAEFETHTALRQLGSCCSASWSVERCVLSLVKLYHRGPRRIPSSCFRAPLLCCIARGVREKCRAVLRSFSYPYPKSSNSRACKGSQPRSLDLLRVTQAAGF